MSWVSFYYLKHRDLNLKKFVKSDYEYLALGPYCLGRRGMKNLDLVKFVALILVRILELSA